MLNVRKSYANVPKSFNGNIDSFSTNTGSENLGIIRNFKLSDSDLMTIMENPKISPSFMADVVTYQYLTKDMCEFCMSRFPELQEYLFWNQPRIKDMIPEDIEKNQIRYCMRFDIPQIRNNIPVLPPTVFYLQDFDENFLDKIIKISNASYIVRTQTLSQDFIRKHFKLFEQRALYNFQKNAPIDMFDKDIEKYGDGWLHAYPHYKINRLVKRENFETMVLGKTHILIGYMAMRADGYDCNTFERKYAFGETYETYSNPYDNPPMAKDFIVYPNKDKVISAYNINDKYPRHKILKVSVPMDNLERDQTFDGGPGAVRCSKVTVEAIF